MARICDNRLRAIRYWRSWDRKDHIEFLLLDLKEHIQTARRKNKADKWWYEDLGRLIDEMDVANDNSITAVYNYLGVPGPWSRR